MSVYQVIEFTGDTESEDSLIPVMFMCLLKSRRNVRKTRCKEIRAVNTLDGEDNLPQNHLLMTVITGFPKLPKLAIMQILESEALLHENKKIQSQNVTPVSIEPLDLWFQVQHSPFWTYLAFACKTETLGTIVVLY